MLHHLIIGNGIAGITAAENIRKNDAEAEITIISTEPEPFYYRPRFPSLIEGSIEKKELFVKSQKEYDELGIDQRLGQQVFAIQPDENEVELDSGESISFDKQETGNKIDTYDYTSFDLSKLRIGKYELKVKIRDKVSGKEVEKTDTFVLMK